MEQARTFPTASVELRYLLVAADYARSLAFYRDVLGATVMREISEVLCLLSFGGAEILLTVGGGPTKDKPTVAFAPPTDADRVSSELNIRVPDCFAAYEALRLRGAEFLTPPVDWGYEVRAFLRDPEGRLIELTQSGQQQSQTGEHVLTETTSNILCVDGQSLCLLILTIFNTLRVMKGKNCDSNTQSSTLAH